MGLDLRQVEHGLCMAIVVAMLVDIADETPDEVSLVHKKILG